MRNILLGVVVVMLTAASVLAEPSGIRKRDPSAASGRPSIKPAGGSNACSAYGPGFVQVEGTETCVKIGGAVGVGAGHSIGSR
jgi:hypothetical protein